MKKQKIKKKIQKVNQGKIKNGNKNKRPEKNEQGRKREKTSGTENGISKIQGCLTKKRYKSERN